jgi:hypothetical protein
MLLIYSVLSHQWNCALHTSCLLSYSISHAPAHPYPCIFQPLTGGVVCMCIQFMRAALTLCSCSRVSSSTLCRACAMLELSCQNALNREILISSLNLQCEQRWRVRGDRVDQDAWRKGVYRILLQTLHVLLSF